MEDITAWRINPTAANNAGIVAAIKLDGAERFAFYGCIRDNQPEIAAALNGNAMNLHRIAIGGIFEVWIGNEKHRLIIQRFWREDHLLALYL